MTTNTPSPRPVLNLAPQIRLTPLPLGGAVLVNTRTLAVTELGEQEADRLGQILADTAPLPDPSSPAATLIKALIGQGWAALGPAPSERI
jgi:hypothetical protein